MSTQVACQCGQRFNAPPHLAGKRVACPTCGSAISIPAAASPAQPATKIVASCQCGQRFNAPSHLAGKRVACPVCKQPLVVPASVSAPVSTPAVDPLAGGGFGSDPLGSPSAPARNDDFWDDLPGVNATPQVPQQDTFGAARAGLADQYMSQAKSQNIQRKKDNAAWGTGQILSGIGMIVGALVWFVGGLFAGVIFFYPPVLLVFGIIALINGIAQKLR